MAGPRRTVVRPVSPIRSRRRSILSAGRRAACPGLAGSLATLPSGPALVAAWADVSGFMPRDGGPIRLPLFECRLGGYDVNQFFSTLRPFHDLALRWPTFGDWKDCLSGHIEELEAARLYDSRVESASATAERFRPLFSDAGHARGER
jgi:hypothetical protein